jgi:hypothetical protein
MSRHIQTRPLISLARRWRLLRAGVDGEDPYRAERTEKYNLRVYPAQTRAPRGAKLFRSREGIRYPQSILLNALIHFHGPKDAAEGEEVRRRLDVALAREPITTNASGA